MRVMAYLGSVLPILALWGCWLWRRRKLRDRPGSSSGSATWAFLAPFVMNTAGWLLTENGRQPWVVQGLLLTEDGNSPSVSLTEVALSLGTFWVLYIMLGIVWGFLMLALRRGVRSSRGPDESTPSRRPGRVRPRPRLSRTEVTLMSLDVVWFVIVAFFWTGFFVLEGFDFGVGVLHKVVGRTDVERRVAINAIGPLWDGNEVWLIVGGAAIFAAFPSWYATWFSAGYLALMLLLVALIIRGVSFEWRAKVDADRWRGTWSWTLTIGSVLVPLAARRRPR